MSLFKYFLVAVAVCWLLTACKTLELDVERTPQPSTPRPASPIQTPRSITLASTPTPDVNAYSGTPQEGVVYLHRPLNTPPLAAGMKAGLFPLPWEGKLKKGWVSGWLVRSVYEPTSP